MKNRNTKKQENNFLRQSRLNNCFVICALCFLLCAFFFVLLVCSGCDVISKPAQTAVPEVTSEPTAEPTPVPTPDPDGKAEDYKGIVISKVYGNSGKTDSVTKTSFIELYNAGDCEINLRGLSVYYKTGNKDYKELVLPDFVMKQSSYYLIKCGECEKNFDETSEIIRLSSWDIEWDDVTIDKDSFSIVLSLSYNKFDKYEALSSLDNVVSYITALEDTKTLDTGSVTDISKSKYITRVALTEDSGFQVVNLTKANSVKLKQILPMYSGGTAGTIIKSNLNEVYFSHDPGFYSEPIELSLTAAEGYTIYYTLNGNDPKTSGYKYTGELYLRDSTSLTKLSTTRHVASILGSSYMPANKKTMCGYVVKAYATNGIDSTPVYTQSYFITKDISEMGVSIMSISLPKEEFVGDGAFYNTYYPSTNDSNERGLACLEVFDENGVRKGYSNVELSVSGHGSSGWTTKSLKIYYKSSNNQEGGLEDSLYYDLFDGYATNANGQTITNFSRLLIRNSGNDCNQTMIRDAFMQRVSQSLNVGTMAYAPTLVFINGEFWGLYNARERYSGEYVESHFGYDADDVAIIESDYSQVHTNTNAPFVLTSGIESDPDDFNELVTYIKSHSMTKQENFDYVASKLDLDSFIDMYIARLYFSAADWPENNIKIWRVRPGSASANEENTKWHFTLLDMDFGMDFPGLGNNASSDYFWCIQSEHCVVSNIMRRLVKNADFKAKFKARFEEVLETVYVKETLLSELTNMLNQREKAFELHVTRWQNGTGISIDNANTEIVKMQNFIKARNKYVSKYIEQYLG